MNPFKFIRSKKNFEVLHAELPGSKGFAEGKLDPSSLTWIFVRKWANEELNKARIQNDILTKDIVQTAALRSRIRTLKDIISLPVIPQEVQFSRESDSNFAGY